jgi:Rho-binding antiterminator
MSDYQPIACAMHDTIEAAILRGQWLEAELYAAGGWHSLRILPLDTLAVNGEEFLCYRVAGAGDVQRVRLDRVRWPPVVTAAAAGQHPE